MTQIKSQQDDPQRINVLSDQYCQQWDKLVSTTNWTKGKIICQWREKLQATGFSAHHYSDEAWSRRVGNVTPQHTGRLRKVFVRFGTVQEEYPKLYWSHFLSALDWETPEIWLEGAQRNRWSVSEMRNMQSTTMRQVETTEMQEDDILLANLTDHVVQPIAGANRPSGLPESGPASSATDAFKDTESESGLESHPANQTAVSPLVAAKEDSMAIDDLPRDFRRVFSRLETMIRKHQASGWESVKPKTLLLQLEKLKALINSPE